jgi:DNA-directed RNA polymerase subunit M/transcription elongation factor TFIIS|uniref:TFIIS-type domain-containing protein n=1 Tax=viral metagenome TaxID=1070528 RepID=A0A6C0H1X0_9ZZZZ
MSLEILQSYRDSIFESINKILKDDDLSDNLENKIYEYSLKYCKINIKKSQTSSILQSIYESKVNDIILNISNNPDLINQIKKNIDDVLEYTPQQLDPANWERIIKRFNYIEDKKTNLAYTDLYQCKKCKGKKGILRQMQNRSADEGATTWFDCYLCGASCKF